MFNVLCFSGVFTTVIYAISAVVLVFNKSAYICWVTTVFGWSTVAIAVLLIMDTVRFYNR